MTIFKNLKEVENFVGKELGTSDWHQITQEQITKFGKVTGDEQWIHMKPCLLYTSPSPRDSV